MKRLALFLDRDGVINIDHGYVYQADYFDFLPGIFDLVRKANFCNYLVIVVTNQAGIGRGYYSENQFHFLTEWMRECFKTEGARIDAVYFCPFHPKYGIGKYLRESNWRKPSPGMLLQAESDLGIDMMRSIFIGDNLSDMAAGLSASVGTLLHLGVSESLKGCQSINHLSDALKFINQY